MSSSNLVRIAFIEESTYGVTPGSGNFSTARFISEALSGTPETVESAQIRTDRLSSGQIVTGLTVGGTMNFELAKEAQLEAFMSSAMYNTWNAVSSVNVDLEIDAAGKELIRASGDWNSNVVVGDFILLDGFSNAENNVWVQVAQINSTVSLRYIGPEGMVDEVGTGTSFQRADKLTIGTTKVSYSMCKQFLDLTTKAINYRGMIASSMELNVAFGELINGSFAFSGNDYVTADSAGEIMTNARTINVPATSQTLNGSIDMPFLGNGAVGVFDNSTLAIQSVTMSLNNNLTAQNVIGDIAPQDYSAGTAAIEIGLSAYLTDVAWDILGKKLSQEPFQLGFMVRNLNGGYGFYMPAVQVSFEDPASAGQNQDILLDMSGQAKVGASGESSLTIYRLP